MNNACKIARLPRPILQELNQRLDSAEPGKQILLWLNALPEVQALLQAEFDSQPIKKQNLADWKQSPRFRNWQLLQTALQFTQDSLPDELDPAHLDKIAANLIRCLQLRFAALASKLPSPASCPPSPTTLRPSSICSPNSATNCRSCVAATSPPPASLSSVNTSPSIRPGPSQNRKRPSGNGPNAPTSRPNSVPSATPTSSAVTPSAFSTSIFLASGPQTLPPSPSPTPPASSDLQKQGRTR